ncbi:MAG: response regulator transcription factor [Bacteroidetes bacterium]|nr:response regulator transcription factor [Bacteroidota bacterium]MBL6944005.1 response regulator transcription factor [Bacteroidales bacterium]
MITVNPKILLVEDDVNFGSVLKSYLELNDFIVDWVDDGEDAMPKFESAKYDLVLIDVMLPNIDGFSIAKKIKNSGDNVPFIFITAKTMRNDIVEGYKTGADDYITKPFDSEILLYKIKAVLGRRSKEDNYNNAEVYLIGDFSFDYRSRSLAYRDEITKQNLSPKESELLKMLIEEKGEILSKTVALNIIWGDANYFTSRSMDVYVAKLRKLLLDDKRVKIITHHGAGYRLITEK